MMSTSTILVTIFLAVVTASAAPSTSGLPRAAILPIDECPDDSPHPQVVLLPSVGNQELAANQYVVCFQGKPLVFTCSEGLFFNWSIMSCDFPYERSASTRSGNGTSAFGDLDLIPIGPIPVPISPELPIPIWWKYLGGSTYGSVMPSYPITRPDPSAVVPLPVLPSFPPQYPITKPDPSVIMPLPVLPAQPQAPFPRPIPYYYHYY